MLCHRDIRFCIKERRGERERAKEEMIPFKKPQTGSNCEYLFYCLLPRRERRGENGRSNTVGKKECESLLGGKEEEKKESLSCMYSHQGALLSFLLLRLLQAHTTHRCTVYT